MKRMLINATQPEELRVAIVDGQKLFNLDIEAPGREQKKANIYKGSHNPGRTQSGGGFRRLWRRTARFSAAEGDITSSFSTPRPSIAADGSTSETAIKEGQEIIVQIEKEERGNKGAALTTFVSLAGRYLVLMPNNPRAGGVSGASRARTAAICARR